MTTGSDKCSFSSILPMSCRGRAEAFARRLHSRLRSLGSQDGSPTNETSWLAANENPVAVSQPTRHSSDSELYFDFTLLDSPGSPEEEIPETDLVKLITNNRDNLHLEERFRTTPKIAAISLNSNGRTISPDSDSSEGQYFDPDSEVVDQAAAAASPLLNGLHACSDESALSLTVSEEDSTLDLQDCPSLEFGSFSHDVPEIADESGGDLLDEWNPNFTDVTEVVAATSNGTESDQLDLDIVTPKQPEEESYCSRLRIENNLTVDFDNSENALVNKVEVDIQACRDDVEDHEEPTPRVRRCSSLKTGKTPPGTPGRKKIVRFADVLGLDLADVRTFLDEIPKVPNSAYSDLLNADFCSSLSDNSLSSSSGLENNIRNVCNKPDKMLVPLFQQPGGQVDFLDRVRENQVCLENAIVDDPAALSIKGTVRVRNLDYHKSVHIRYSSDSWRTYSDLQAAYAPNSCDGFSDKFSFLLYANAVSVGQRLELAVRFQCKGCQYWDSNGGANYAFQCLPSKNQTPYAPITGADDHWGATFY